MEEKLSYASFGLNQSQTNVILLHFSAVSVAFLRAFSLLIGQMCLSGWREKCHETKSQQNNGALLPSQRSQLSWFSPKKNAEIGSDQGPIMFLPQVNLSKAGLKAKPRPHVQGGTLVWFAFGNCRIDIKGKHSSRAIQLTLEIASQSYFKSLQSACFCIDSAPDLTL